MRRERFGSIIVTSAGMAKDDGSRFIPADTARQIVAVTAAPEGEPIGGAEAHRDFIAARAKVAILFREEREAAEAAVRSAYDELRLANGALYDDRTPTTEARAQSARDAVDEARRRLADVQRSQSVALEPAAAAYRRAVGEAPVYIGPADAREWGAFQDFRQAVAAVRNSPEA